METIVFLDRGSVPAPLKAPAFEHRWAEFESTEANEVDRRIFDATIVITNKVKLPADSIAAAPKLKFVAACATGTDHIDLDACRERQIVVSNIRDYATQTVAEHAIALLFSLARQLPAYQRDVRDGAWCAAKHFCLASRPIRDLADITLAVVGSSGGVGNSLVRLAAAIGIEVWRTERKSATAVRDGYVAWRKAIHEADAISLHCPLLRDTRNLIDDGELRQMKRDVLLINTGRGGLINEAALASALIERRIGGAGIDVLTEEPPSRTNPLLNLDLPNLIITPHNAWTAQSAVRKLTQQLTKNLEAFAAGTPHNRVV